MANGTAGTAGEPSLTTMAKYTVALQESFEKINDVLSQHAAGYINEKTSLEMIEEVVREVISD